MEWDLSHPSNYTFNNDAIRNGADVVRALALGADAVGITGSVLRKVMEEGVDAAVDYLEAVAEELRAYMLLTGCCTIRQLRKVPLIINGETLNFVNCRGYNLPVLCRERRTN